MEVNYDYKIKFCENIIKKEDLKKIFYKTYNSTRNDMGEKHSVIGLNFENTNDSICYTLTGFTLFARMQYILYHEINNLVTIEEINTICTKMNGVPEKCLNKKDAIDFNKYLLIQTFIEYHSDEILTHINCATKLSKNGYLPEIRIAFIRNRMEQYAFAIDKEPTLLELFTSFIISSKDKMLDIYHKLALDENGYVNNDYSNPTFMELNKKLSYDNESLCRSCEIPTEESSTSGFENDLRQLLNVEIENKTEIDDKIGSLVSYLESIKEQKQKQEQKQIQTEIKKLEQIQEINNKMIEIINQFSEGKLKLEDLKSDDDCMNSFLKKTNASQTFLKSDFGLKIDGQEFVHGNESVVTFRTLVKMINTSNCIISSVSRDDDIRTITSSNGEHTKSNTELFNENIGKLQFNNEKYILLHGYSPSLNDYIKGILLANIDGYRIVGLALKCDGKHSIISLCYGHDCIDNKYYVLNDHERYKVELKVDIVNQFGTHCNQNLIEIESILYEKDDVVLELNTIIMEDLKLRSHRIIHGGNLYYTKYLKYKTKYLELKKLI
jgi:hypothetical protein